MILPWTTNCGRLGKTCGISGVKDGISVLHLLGIRHLLWKCPASITWTFTILSMEYQGLTAYYENSSHLLLGIFLNLLPTGISAVSYVLEKTVNANSVIAFSVWIVIIVIKVHENVCVGKPDCGLFKEVHTYQRPSWEHQVTSVKFYLNWKNCVCVCVVGLLFQGIKRQMYSKSRMSALLASFLGSIFFHFLHP